MKKIFFRVFELKTFRKHIEKVIDFLLRKNKKREDPDSRYRDAVKDLPRITNENVAEHREEILGSARKYIYPLHHSKHRVVVTSASLIVIVVVVFFSYCGIALYQLQSDNSFIYGITQIIPFPVAKAHGSFVAYENYLFDLRHYIHYYQSQQRVNFNTPSGIKQLDNYKRQALNDVVNQAYIKQLADQNNISVSNQEVNNEIALVKQQDRLGSSQREFKDVLSEFWGWNVNDFKRALKQQLLSEKVVSKLDTQTHARATAALKALQSGASFATVATQYSDDLSTKTNGGRFNFTIDQTSQNIPPQTLNTLLKLQPGHYSGIINLGTGLEIDEVISNTNGKIQAAHILFNFQPISTYINPLKKKYPPQFYIKVD